MAIWALAGTLAFSFLLELIGASAANSSGWGIVGAIAAMGAFLIHTIKRAKKKTQEEEEKPEEETGAHRAAAWRDFFSFYAFRSASRVRRALRNWTAKRMEVKVTARVSATGSAR